MKRKSLYLILGLLIFVQSAWAVSGYPQKPKVVNQTLTSANTEYQVTLPNGTGGFSIQSRSAADFKIGTTSNLSGTTYFTVKSGTVYSTPTPLGLGDETLNTTLFLQSTTAGQIIEILYFQ